MVAKYDPEQIATLYADLRSISAVARLLDACPQTIVNALKVKGLWKTKRFTPPHNLPVSEVLSLYGSGLGCERIAAQLGGTSESVRNLLKKHGIARRAPGPSFGHLNPAWKGGRTIDKGGYVLIHRPDHPNSNGAGYVREHRLVMEATLGRYLRPHEVVHHIDADRANNAPENLLLFETNNKHLRHELTGRCPKWTEEGLSRIRAVRPPPAPWSDEHRRNHKAAHARRAARRKAVRLELG